MTEQKEELCKKFVQSQRAQIDDIKQIVDKLQSHCNDHFSAYVALNDGLNIFLDNNFEESKSDDENLKRMRTILMRTIHVQFSKQCRDNEKLVAIYRKIVQKYPDAAKLIEP